MKNKKYKLKELQAMETIHSGHFDNLKFDDGETRIWLSRMTVADGAPYNNQVIVEWYNGHYWVKVREYEAK